MRAAITLTTLATVALSWVGYAQAPLAGQAGSANTARAQAPARIKSVRQTPSVAPQAESAKTSDKDSVVIGVIDKLCLVGPASFLDSENVANLLLLPLCDGCKKTVGDLRAAIASAKRELANRGYYFIYIAPSKANAYDPEEKLLELAVEPGRFGKVEVSMKEDSFGWYTSEQVEKRFKHTEEHSPFNYNTLRQAIRTVNGHPDLMSSTKISVHTEQITNDVDATCPWPPVKHIDTALEVDDGLPLHATLDVNNYAMDELDNWQMTLAVQYLNLTHADDVLTITPGLTFNGDMWSVAASYMRPFDLFSGGSWSIYGGYSDMNCDDAVEQQADRLNLEGVGGFAGINTSWNLWDTEARNVAFVLGLMWRYIRDDWSVESGSLRSSLSRRDVNILPITAGFTYGDKRRDSFGGLDFLSLTETINLGFDDDKFERYSEDAEVNYSVLRGSWSRLQPLSGPSADGEEWRCWSLFTQVEGQYSFGEELITTERLALGGYSCLRGYRSRGYLGDDGVYGTVEFRTPVWCNPVSGYFLSEDSQLLLERVQLVAFCDAGYVTYSSGSKQSQEDSEFLYSAGIGIRGALSKNVSIKCDLAFPLEKGYADENDDDLELYISVKFQF